MALEERLLSRAPSQRRTPSSPRHALLQDGRSTRPTGTGDRCVRARRSIVCLHDDRSPGVEGIYRLSGLEIHVRVLRGAADERVLWRQGPGAVGAHEVFWRPRSAGLRQKAARSCSVRGRSGSRRRNGRKAPGWRASPRGPRAPSRAPLARMPKPGWRSRSDGRPSRREWSPKIDNPWAAKERAATWTTAAVSSPAILYMFGTISKRP